MSTICPSCKGKTSCLDSRSYKTDPFSTTRRYVCRKCATAFTTAEFIVSVNGEVAPVLPPKKHKGPPTVTERFLLAYVRRFIADNFGGF